jgi:glucose uptake protein
MLLLTEAIGTGKGFTIAQLGLVVNALVGIFVLKDPKPGTRAATVTFAGVVVAMVGAILLGNLR